MKVAITCDYLLGREHQTQAIESLLEVFKDAHIYTLAHLPRSLGDTIESRPIHSTYLSNIVTTPEQFFSKAWIIPTVAKKLQIPCNTDLIFSLSQGLGHGINKCKETRQITYLYQNYSPSRRLKEKFFSAYLKSWSHRKLLLSNEIWVSRSSLLESCQKFHPNTQLVEPALNIDNFPLFSQEQRKHLPQNFYAINSKVLDQKLAYSLIKIFEKLQFNYKFIGPHQHLGQLPEKNSSFQGEHCPGELAPILAASSALIHLAPSSSPREGFPILPLLTLATGRPVIVQKNQTHQDFLGKLDGKGVYFIDHLEQLPDILKKISNETNFNPQHLRALAMNYHHLKFKSKVQRKFSEYL